MPRGGSERNRQLVLKGWHASSAHMGKTAPKWEGSRENADDLGNCARFFRTLSKGKLVIACEQPVGVVSASA
jgi:hypothetical protein